MEAVPYASLAQLNRPIWLPKSFNGCFCDDASIQDILIQASVPQRHVCLLVLANERCERTYYAPPRALLPPDIHCHLVCVAGTEDTRLILCKGWIIVPNKDVVSRSKY